MKSSKKSVIVLTICMAVILVMAACGQMPSGSGSGGSGGGVKIGYDGLATGVDYDTYVKEGLIAAAEKEGMTVVVATSEIDAQKAMANADSFLEQGCDIIVDFCVMADTGAAITQKAAAKGVPVISIDVPYDGAYYFGVHNFDSGVMGGKYAGEKIIEEWGGEVDSLVLTYADEAGPDVKARVEGMRAGIEEVLGKAIPDKDVYFFDDQNNQPLVVKQIVTDFLTAHPDQKRIMIGCLDDPTAGGAVSAVETQGRQSDVFIISTGGEQAYRDTINKDNPPLYWIGSVAYFPETYGYGIVPYIKDILAGKDVEKARYQTTQMLTPANMKELYPNG